jgi:antitoxin YefM
MRPLRVDKDIRSLSEFRAGLTSFVKQVNETRRPLVLTQHGRGVAVLVGISEYAAMRARLETIEDIAAARAQLATGEGVSHEEAKKRVLDGLR